MLSEPQQNSSGNELKWLNEKLHKKALLHKDHTNPQTILMQTIFFCSNKAESPIWVAVGK